MTRLPAATAVDYSDANREQRALRDDLDRGYATAPDESEIVGWGSSAHWRTNG